MNDNGILKLTGIITDFSIWDDTIETSDEPYDALCQFVTDDYVFECCLDLELQK
jgi:hypothetical protein